MRASRRTGHAKEDDTTSRSRGAWRPSLHLIHPHRKQRAQGRPGALRTHGPRAAKKHAAEPQVRAEATGLPCAMVLRLIRDLPGDRLLNAHIFCCGGGQRLIPCWRRRLEEAMREEIGLGRFGDRRLEKGGCRCMRRWYEGPVRVFDALLGTERGKFSSRAFCATRR